MDGGSSDTEASRAARRSKWDKRVKDESSHRDTGANGANGSSAASAGDDDLDSLLSKDYGGAVGGNTPTMSGILNGASNGLNGGTAANAGQSPTVVTEPGAVPASRPRTHSPSGRKLSTRERSMQNRRIQLAEEEALRNSSKKNAEWDASDLASSSTGGAAGQNFVDGSSMRGSVRSSTVPSVPSDNGGSGLPPTARWGSPPPAPANGDVSERVAAAAGAGGTVSEEGGSDSSVFSVGDPPVSYFSRRRWRK